KPGGRAPGSACGCKEAQEHRTPASTSLGDTFLEVGLDPAAALNLSVSGRMHQAPDRPTLSPSMRLAYGGGPRALGTPASGPWAAEPTTNTQSKGSFAEGVEPPNAPHKLQGRG